MLCISSGVAESLPQLALELAQSARPQRVLIEDCLDQASCKLWQALTSDAAPQVSASTKQRSPQGSRVQDAITSSAQLVQMLTRVTGIQDWVRCEPGAAPTPPHRGNLARLWPSVGKPKGQRLRIIFAAAAGDSMDLGEVDHSAAQSPPRVRCLIIDANDESSLQLTVDEIWPGLTCPPGVVVDLWTAQPLPTAPRFIPYGARLPLIGVGTSHPTGHFYSPVCDPDELASRREELWPTPPRECVGIDFDDESHRQVLQQWFPRFIGDYDYPEHGPEDQELAYYYTQNSQFSWLDSRALFVLMRALKPRRMIEVGSGYSSLLMADINQRFLDGSVQIRCIEPYPRAFLQRGIAGLAEVVVKRVQDVPLSEFADLQANDILFIDSSHVSKTGSDVNYLFFEVLPRLQPGVIVHVHDIFLPAEYLESWAIEHNRSWNEQYLLRALLMYSSAFKPVFGCYYAGLKHADVLRSALAFADGRVFAGGSFWLRRL